MMDMQLPYGNGQEIYIDPEMLHVKPEWINHELHACFMPGIPSEQSNPVYELYKEMFKQFYDMGYKVVTDSEMTSNDAFFLTPCLDKHINSTKEEYTAKKKHKINLCLANNRITTPITINFPIDSFPQVLPPLPFVLKNETKQGGIEKFLIKTTDQLEVLKKFYHEINLYSRKKLIEEIKQNFPQYKHLEFDENGRAENGRCIAISDYKKEFHENMVLQEYVKTPTEYNTSLRVLFSSSGDILCSSLKYSNNGLSKETQYDGLFDKYLSDPFSPYFIDSESIVSNTVAGGNSILLGKDKYSKIEQEILNAHGINPSDARLPKSIMEACIDIALNCSREVGAICGIDFIFDDNNKTWKYLEEHEFPMLSSYAEKYDLPYDFNADDFYITHQLLDIRARLHALSLTIQKKINLENDSTKKIK